MNKLTAKEKLQLILKQNIEEQKFSNAYENLKIYIKTFGFDNFSNNYKVIIHQYINPLVSLICLNCSDKSIDHFLSYQHYSNLEIVRTSKEDSYKDIIEYIIGARSKYICFFEENHSYSSDKITDMVWYLESHSDIDIAICYRNFIDSQNTVIASPEQIIDPLPQTTYNGKVFLEYCIQEGKNLYGNLSTIMLTHKSVQQIKWNLFPCKTDAITRLSFLYQFLLNGTIGFIDTTLVSTILQNYQDNSFIQKEYHTYTTFLSNENDISLTTTDIKEPSKPISMEITFFYTDMGEYYNLEPIANEAKKRGYHVEFTQNIQQKAEIGIYCQHICYPKNAKFSVILLHDLAQGHNRWPNIWELERWNQFDIGIVPGASWASLWSTCACQYYVNPKYGTFELGYPKSDLINSNSLKERAKELQERLNLKYNFSVLYAPSWENDEKEDDFIRACASLNINLLIKQAHWSSNYQFIIDNINKMQSLHKGKYENVYYIEPKESIMTALELCDIVVSDESSVMSEAIMFGKPSVAVTDWLIPDTVPSRLASVPIDYVYKCKKVELREYVEKLSSDPAFRNAILEKGHSVYSNQGNCCKDILDAIEYYTNQNSNCNFLNKKLSSKYEICSMWN